MPLFSFFSTSRVVRVLLLFCILFIGLYLQGEHLSVADLKGLNPRVLLNVFAPILLVLVTLVMIYVNGLSLRIGVADLLLIAFILFQIFNYLCRYDVYSEDLVLFSFAAVAALFVKQLFYHDRYGSTIIFFTSLVIILLGVFEVVYGQLQIFRMATITNHQAIVTGTFNYPGPFAILVSSVLVFCVGLLLFGDPSRSFYEKAIVGPALFFILITIPIIPATQSRTAWMGLIAGMGYLGYVRYRHQLTEAFQRLKKGSVFFLSLLLLSVAGTYGLYLLYDFKSASVHGRLRVWEMTLRYFADYPLFGVGHGQFKYEYGKIQSESIGDRINDQTVIYKADHVIYVFNDFLQLLVENGLVGFLLFAIYIYGVNRSFSREVTGKKPYWVSASGAFGVILISCMSSYPMEMPLIVTLFFVFGSMLSFYSDGRTYVLKGGLLQGGIVLLSAVLITWNVLLKEVFITKVRATDWSHALKLYHDHEFQRSVPYFQATCRHIPGEPEYLMAYGRALYLAGNYEESERILKMASDRIHDSILMANLGDAYFGQKKYDLAEQAYLSSISISPVRLYPRFLLVNLFMEKGDTVSAKREAAHLMRIKVPVPSPASDSIRAQMHKLLL